MSVIYKGSASQLIIAPGESYNISPSGLVTLQREYSCASSYADDAEEILEVGSVAEGYEGDALSLFTKTKKKDGAITTFSCTYTGASGDSLITIEQEINSFSYTFTPFASAPITVTGRYFAPSRTVEIAVAESVAAAPTPAPFSTYTIIEAYANGTPYTGNGYLGGSVIQLASYREQPYGDYKVVTYTHIMRPENA
jgi:hypothetical protein